LVAIRLEECRYRRLANPHDRTGRWPINGRRLVVYIRRELMDHDGFQAVKALRDAPATWT
jgi:hypothetical protein